MSSKQKASGSSPAQKSTPKKRVPPGKRSAAVSSKKEAGTPKTDSGKKRVILSESESEETELKVEKSKKMVRRTKKTIDSKYSAPMLEVEEIKVEEEEGAATVSLPGLRLNSLRNPLEIEDD